MRPKSSAETLKGSVGGSSCLGKAPLDSLPAGRPARLRRHRDHAFADPIFNRTFQPVCTDLSFRARDRA